MSALEDMETAAKSGAEAARKAIADAAGVPGAALQRSYRETQAQGYRMAVQGLRKLGLDPIAGVLDQHGFKHYGEDYRTLPVEGEPKR